MKNASRTRARYKVFTTENVPFEDYGALSDHLYRPTLTELYAWVHHYAAKNNNGELIFICLCRFSRSSKVLAALFLEPEDRYKNAGHHVHALHEWHDDSVYSVVGVARARNKIMIIQQNLPKYFHETPNDMIKHRERRHTGYSSKFLR